jgi:multidrug efflux pump subunit AcrB
MRGPPDGAPDIINRLRPKMNRLPVANAFLQAAQDLRIGGRGGNALYQYTIQSDNVQDLAKWGPILLAEMKKLPGFQDVNTDAQNVGLQELLTYDRSTAARLGITRHRSTARSTAPLASPRFPSSTPSSTSITWCWKWRRRTGRARKG